MERFSPLASGDRLALDRHADIRRLHGYRSDLERLVFGAPDLAQLLESTFLQQVLSPADASAECEVLSRFAVRSQAMLESELPNFKAFTNRLGQRRPELQALVSRLAQLYEIDQHEIPVFLLPAASDCRFGGGFHGHCITLEIPGERDVIPILIHEVLHALNFRRRDLVKKAIRHVPGLNFRILDEGLAHSLAPGVIFDTNEGPDPLTRLILAKLDSRSHWRRWDHEWMLFHRFGLVLRPLLARVLADSSFGFEADLLPRATELWCQNFSRALPHPSIATA